MSDAPDYEYSMNLEKLLRLAAVGAVVLTSCPSGAVASTLEYSFQTIVTTGPLTGAYDGTFSFDSSVVSPGNRVDGADLLTNLNFTFSGTTFTTSTANTGSLTFAADGSLSTFLFGTACQADQCFGNTFPPHILSWIATPGGQGFSYYDINALELGTGNLTFQAVSTTPLPSAIPLFATGLGLLSLLGWRRRRKAQAVV